MLRGSQVLSIMNNAAVNIVEQYPCARIEHHLSICPRIVSLGLEVD